MIPVTQALSPWFAATPDKLRYPALRGRVETDVVVVGTGIAGVLTAWRLSQRGARVVLLEKNHVATGDTGYTTAFVTRVPDASLPKLVARYGEPYLKSLVEAAADAQDWLRTTLRTEHVECSWQDCWSYHCSYHAGDAVLAEEWPVARRVDQRASLVRGRDVQPANPAAAEAVRFDGEARFDARAALVGLLATEIGKRINIYEETPATDIILDGKHDPVIIKTPRGEVRAKTLVVTTGRPLDYFSELQSLVTPQVTYAITVQYAGQAPISDDVFWDTDEPYQYYRRLDRHTIILGGADHVSGRAYPERPSPHEQLELFARSKLPGDGTLHVTSRWSGSLFYTEDEIPYAGRHPHHPNVLVATGFGGNGMVMGALASSVLADLVTGRANAACKLLAFERTNKPLLRAMPQPAPASLSSTAPAASDRALIAILRVALPLAFVTALVLPALVFFNDRGGTGFLADKSLQQYGILLFPLVGLYAFTLLWIQFLLGSNMYPLMRVFPRVQLFHRTQGPFVLAFALLHPTLLLLGVGGVAAYFRFEFVPPNLVPWVWVGELQLTLLIATVATALLRKTKWLKKRWHWIHYTNYVVFTLVWLHSWNLGTDVQSHLAWLWYFYGATALLSAGARLYRGVRDRRRAAGAAPAVAGRAPAWVAVAKAGEVPEGKPTCVTANNQRIALFKVDNKFYAINNTCTHQGGPLCEGSLKESVVTCPWHGSRFNVTTGALINGPAERPITTFPVRERAGQVEVLA